MVGVSNDATLSQANIHQDDVGFVLDGCGDRFVFTASFGDNTILFMLVEKGFHAHSDDFVVVDEEYTHWINHTGYAGVFLNNR